jgi:hypothetical protein
MPPGRDHPGAAARAALATTAGHRALTAAAVTGAVAMALACIGRRRPGSEPGEAAAGTPVPGASATFDHG